MSKVSTELGVFAQALSAVLHNAHNRSGWAARLGVTEAAISKWVSDKSLPSAENLRALFIHAREFYPADSTELKDFVAALNARSYSVTPNHGRAPATLGAYQLSPLRASFERLLMTLDVMDQEAVLEFATLLARARRRCPLVDFDVVVGEARRGISSASDWKVEPAPPAAADRYERGEPLEIDEARGVANGTDRLNHCPVAVEWRRKPDTYREFVDRTSRWAEASRKLPGLLAYVIDIELDRQGRPFAVFGLPSGGNCSTLPHWLTVRRTIPTEERLQIFFKMVRAVGSLEDVGVSGVYVAPDNILVGLDQRPVFTEWGSALKGSGPHWRTSTSRGVAGLTEVYRALIPRDEELLALSTRPEILLFGGSVPGTLQSFREGVASLSDEMKRGIQMDN